MNAPLPPFHPKRRQLAACLLSIGLALTCSGQVAPRESLAARVPAEVDLFVEVRDVEEILVRLTDPYLWTALSEISGRPASAADATQWRDQVQSSLRMPLESAIRRLFARGVAFASVDQGAMLDAIVVCRPTESLPPARLLSYWGATPLPAQAGFAQAPDSTPVERTPTASGGIAAGGTAPTGVSPRERASSARVVQPDRLDTSVRSESSQVFALRNQARVAVAGDALLFGVRTDGSALLDHALRLDPTTSARLSRDATFRALHAELPGTHDGVLFARLGDAATPRPLPGAFQRSSAVLVTLARSNEQLELRAVGDRPPVRVAGQSELFSVGEALPESTWALWGTRVDWPKLRSRIADLPATHPVRVVTSIISTPLNDIARTAHPEVCIAIGPGATHRDATNARSGLRPDLPAAAIVLRSAEPAFVAQRITAAAEALRSFYNLLALQNGLPLVDAGKTHAASTRGAETESTSVWCLDLTPLLPTRSGALAELPLELCVATNDERVIIASDRTWLAEVVTAQQATPPPLRAALRSITDDRRSEGETLAFVSIEQAAARASRWLVYLGITAPHVLNDAWWRSWQPGGADVRLGIVARPSREPAGLRVQRVAPAALAANLLNADDLILGVDGTRLATDGATGDATGDANDAELVANFQRLLRERPDPRRVVLLVERRGSRVRVTVPIPFIDPVEVLRRVSALGTLARGAVFADFISPPEAHSETDQPAFAGMHHSRLLLTLSPAPDAPPSRRIPPRDNRARP